jgi:ribonuclease Z
MNSVEAGKSWSHGDLKFHGLSLSGIRTSIALPEMQLAFDVAQGYPFLIPIKKFFLSHGHLDHVAGVPYIISQKVLFHMPVSDFYMPPSLVEPLQKIMDLWQQIEDHQYKCNFISVDDKEIEINDRHFVKAFPTFHRIESFGYTLFQKNKKLLPKWQNAHKEKIIAAKKHGEKIDAVSETPLVSFTGDTKIEFLFERDWIRKSKVLFLESTYLDDKKTIEQARKWGHTHLDEIIPHLNEIDSEKIVLIHISSRYSYEHAMAIIKKKIPSNHQDRIVVFPGR